MGGAHIAIATGNDALTVNPAGIPQQRRYHLELDGVMDPHFPAQALMVSVGDGHAYAKPNKDMVTLVWRSVRPVGCSCPAVSSARRVH